MKKKTKMLAVILAVMLTVTCVPVYESEVRAAETFTEGDFKYQLSGKEADIVEYTGMGGDVTIPGELGGKKVKTIGGSLFVGNSRITSITVSEGVLVVRMGTFKNCVNLKSVSLPSSIGSVDGEAFYGCSSLESITVAEGSELYDSRDNCNALIRKSDDMLMVGCKGTVIPNSVKRIWEGAFYGCNTLEHITIPDSVTEIGEKAFADCSSLTEISIPNSVKTIGKSAFANCIRLKSVSIPGSMETISKSAFADCASLTEVSISDGVKILDESAFSGCRSLTEIDLPDSVTNIEDAAFADCVSLRKVRLSKNTERIWSEAFSGCRSLTSINIPFGVTKVISEVLDGCRNLTRVSIPNSVTLLGWRLFSECKSLKEVSIPSSVTRIESYNEDQNVYSEDFVIYGESGSYAEEYAEHNGISFEAIEGNDIRWAAVTLEDEFYVYDGTAKTPSVSLEMNGEALVPDTDYTISSYADNTEPGTAKVTVTGKGAYQGSMEVAFKILEDISEAEITWDKLSYFRLSDGTIIPQITVKMGEKTLKRDTDYYIIPYSSIDETDERTVTAVVTVTGLVSYIGTRTVEVTVNRPKKDISQASVVLDKVQYAYDGTPKTPSATVILDGKKLVPDTDYTVEYSNNTEVGLASVHVLGKGDYQGSITKNFRIYEAAKKNIAKAVVTMEGRICAYDGTAKTPAVTVILNGKTLVPDTDYTVTYSDNINVGTATVTVKGIGNYTGSVTEDFTIVGSGENPGGNQTGDQTGDQSGNQTGDQTGDQSGNQTGNQTVNQTGKPDYTITCKKTVYETVYGAKPFKIDASSKSALTFTSSDTKIAAVDKNTGTVTIKGTGIATITIKAGSNTVNVTVKVNPKKTSLKSAKPSKGKKLTVKWAKDKNASGYQVQVSTDRNFKKNRKQKNVTKTSYTFPKLKAGKKYYVRVRSYKKFGKETLYGAWSKSKRSGKVKSLVR